MHNLISEDNQSYIFCTKNEFEMEKINIHPSSDMEFFKINYYSFFSREIWNDISPVIKGCADVILGSSLTTVAFPI